MRAVVSVVVVALVCMAQVAVAGPRAVLVLRSEGTADTSSRTSVDTHVLRLAKNIDGKVEAGDITFTEAAAVVGCTPSEASCKDDVLTTLGVDEVIATTVTATPTGLNVTVRRIAKGGAPKAAQTTIPSGRSPDAKLDADIGPLFGLTAAPPPVEPKPAETTPVAGTTAPPPPPTTTTTSPAPATAPPPSVAVEDHSTAPMNDVTAAPNGQLTQTVEGAPPNRRWPKIGMGVGAGMVALGILLWADAASIQSDIDDRPEPTSAADIQALKDLEKKGDGAAGLGNLMFLGGAVLGGVSTYYYIKAGRSSTQQARIAPAVFPGGGGITLTLGGTP